MHLLFLTMSAALLHASLTSAHPRRMFENDLDDWNGHEFPHAKLEKLRRGSSGLVPFPRVGRAGGGGGAPRTWEVIPDDYSLAEPENVQKRPLYAFPRVGRSELVPWSRLPAQLQLQELENLLLETRARAASGSGTATGTGYAKRNIDSGNMWFGPRLGRSSDKDFGEYDEDSTQKSLTSEQGYPERAELTSENRNRRQSD